MMLKHTLTGLLFLTFFFIFIVPMQDTDFGWHYRCGGDLATLGKLCRVNRYTYLLSGFKWNSPSQGYDLLLYFLYRSFRFPGIIFFYALSAAFVFTFFVKSLKGGLLANALMTAVGLWFSWSIFSLGFRSQILSIYFLAIFLTIINLSESNKKYLWTLPVISLIWTNSHSGFFLGPLVVLALMAEHCFEYWEGKIPLKDLKLTAIILALTVLATLINPFGPLIYQEVFRHTQVPLNTLIAEWVSPLPWQIFLIISTTVFALTRLWQKENKNIFGIILISFFAFISVEARRNLPLFSLASVFVISYMLDRKQLLLSSSRSVSRDPEPGFRVKSGMTRVERVSNLITYLLLILMILFFATKNVPGTFKYEEKIYSQNALVTLPYEGVKFMQAQEPGNIFNTYEWGGYLIWKMPKFKIFTDGRMPSWDTLSEKQLPENWRGKSPYTIYIETIQTQPGWQEVLNAYKTDYIMIQSGAYLDLVLKAGQEKYGFQNIYDKEGTSIFKKI